MAPLTRHNFTYGPTIHVRTQIQHRGPARAEQEVVVGARIVEVYDRKDHWYQVLDGLVVGDGGTPGCPELARIRHHSIFRPRGTDLPGPDHHRRRWWRSGRLRRIVTTNAAPQSANHGSQR